MKFTLSWLKTHLDTDADLATILKTLNAIGLEVDWASLLQRCCWSAMRNPAPRRGRGVSAV